MDTAKATTHIGLCAGYGGIELGLGRVIPNLRSVALCEIEAFAIANLVAKMEAGLMDPAPVWPDLKTFPWGAFRDRVDILTGGYPCQPFSAAGKRAGKDDPRHLWPYIADGIRLLQPRLCFFENVEGHITLGLSDVIEDLAGMGYRTTWGLFSAAEVGAPHQRKRVFILAHRDGERGQLPDWWGLAAKQVPVGNGKAWRDVWPSRPGEQQYGWEPPRVVAPMANTASVRCGKREHTQNVDGSAEEEHQHEQGFASNSPVGCDPDAMLADGHRLDRGAPAEGREHDRQAGSTGEAVGDTEVRQDNGRGSGDMEGEAGEGRRGDDASDGAGEFQHILDSVWQAEPPLGGDADGSPSGMDHAELYVSCDNRTDELRLLGNGVVPATAERAFRVLMAELMHTP